MVPRNIYHNIVAQGSTCVSASQGVSDAFMPSRLEELLITQYSKVGVTIAPDAMNRKGLQMSTFGKTLKDARLREKKTLREVGDYMGLSVGYISDIEQGRKSAPDLETVRKLQDFLRVENNALLTLASEERTNRPTEIVQHMQNRPKLSELFMRARNLSDEQLEKLIEASKRS